ncbi:C repressor [Pseudanabaena phage Pam5]|nr:C repressor [Pseudanabaena phage Pam5]
MLTTRCAPDTSLRFMSDGVTSIHKGRQPKRPHYVREWAEQRGMRAVDLAIELDVDKSVVSRWFSGSTPSEESQAKLAAFFGCEPESLFRHPDDDWLAKFFKDRERDEVERIKSTLETAFPRKAVGQTGS